MSSNRRSDVTTGGTRLEREVYFFPAIEMG